MGDRIWFNVQGTYFLTTRETVTQRYPEGMLAMLLRHPDTLSDRYGYPVWFVNRDAGMFRWILLALNTGQLVDHATVGVPKDVWETELDYYGLVENAGPTKRQRTVIDPDIQVHIERLERKADEDRLAREREFKRLVEFCAAHMHHTNVTRFEFVSTGMPIMGYPTDIWSLDLIMLYNFRNDAAKFADALGFDLRILSFVAVSRKRRRDHYPAHLVELHSEHEYLFLTIQRNAK